MTIMTCVRCVRIGVEHHEIIGAQNNQILIGVTAIIPRKLYPADTHL